MYAQSKTDCTHLTFKEEGSEQLSRERPVSGVPCLGIRATCSTAKVKLEVNLLTEK